MLKLRILGHERGQHLNQVDADLFIGRAEAVRVHGVGEAGAHGIINEEKVSELEPCVIPRLQL